MSFHSANWCNYVFYLWLGSTSIGHARRVKTRNDNGLRIRIFSQKLPFSVGKKMFQRQIQEVQYIILIRYITNISDFEWFQRSCGSMKSVSSFSSIDILFYVPIKNIAFIRRRFHYVGDVGLGSEPMAFEQERIIFVQHSPLWHTASVFVASFKWPLI